MSFMRVSTVHVSRDNESIEYPQCTCTQPYSNTTGAVLTVVNDTQGSDEKAFKVWHPLRMTLVYLVAW